MALHLLPPASPSSMPQRGRISGAALCSMGAHALALIALLWLTYAHVRDQKNPEPEMTTARVVWVAMPGPSGGGGGSKAITPPPPKLTPPPATRTTEVPVPVPTEVTPPAPAPVEPAPEVAAVADTPSSGAFGTTAAAPGNGPGRGAGPGDGDGAGPGKDKGFGGDAYRPGNGVTTPVPIERGRPVYTAEAVRARAQGVMTVECVVEPNGECGDLRIVRGFTPPFGLDQQALAAARRWRFRPGTRDGEPVPVLINLLIEFNIR